MEHNGNIPEIRHTDSRHKISLGKDAAGYYIIKKTYDGYHLTKIKDVIAEDGISCRDLLGLDTGTTNTESSMAADMEAALLKGKVQQILNEPTLIEPIGLSRSQDQRYTAFGVNLADGEPAVIDWSRSANVLVTGPFASGKTSLARTVIQQQLNAGCKIAIIDCPKADSDYNQFKDKVMGKGWGQGNFKNAMEVLDMVSSEMKKRSDLLIEHGCDWRDLPETVLKDNPPILLVVDEASFILNRVIPSRDSNKQRESQTGKDTRSILEARLRNIASVGKVHDIRIMVITQKPETSWLDYEFPSVIAFGHASAKPNEADRETYAKSAVELTTLRQGMGVAKLDRREGIPFKAYYDTTEAF